jgi:hypothetical protein
LKYRAIQNSISDFPPIRVIRFQVAEREPNVTIEIDRPQAVIDAINEVLSEIPAK